MTVQVLKYFLFYQTESNLGEVKVSISPGRVTNPAARLFWQQTVRSGSITHNALPLQLLLV